LENYMKFSYASAVAAMALMATLAGCGGKAQFTVQGTVTGLKNSGLVLANGGSTVSVPTGATSFAFPQQIDYGTEYNITVQTNPAHMNCGVSLGSGSAGYTVSIQAQVTCQQNSYTLGGQFTGLKAKADGTARTVTLLNGTAGGTVLVSSVNGDTNGAGSFAFGSLVEDGAAYGVTVVDDATSDVVCTLANGAGVMHETAVTNLLLTCVPK
jgi:hypothetical protein